MAQTKRKRRSKHRGNAAGTIAARGRTGRKPLPEETGKAAGKGKRNAGVNRLDREPTWGAATTRAVFAAAVLFLLTQIGLFGADLSLASALLLSVLAVLLYIPLGYWTDRALYNWRQKRLKAQEADKK
jgi:hypothetical protein